MWNSWSDLAKSISSGELVPCKLARSCPIASPVQALLQPLPWIRQRAGLWGVHEAGMCFFVPPCSNPGQRKCLSFSPCFVYGYLLPYELRRAFGAVLFFKVFIASSVMREHWLVFST